VKRSRENGALAGPPNASARTRISDAAPLKDSALTVTFPVPLRFQKHTVPHAVCSETYCPKSLPGGKLRCSMQSAPFLMQG
jgi:hypothetical protein